MNSSTLIKLLIIISSFSIGAFEILNDKKKIKIHHENFSYHPIDDSYANGISKAKITHSEDKTKLSCTIKKSEYLWPICGIKINLGRSSTHGIDLSNFDNLAIKIDYIRKKNNTKQTPNLRVFLRSYDKELHKKNGEYLTKYHGVELRNYSEKKQINVPINRFQVLTWWLVDNKISIENSDLDLSNTVYLEILTGSEIVFGHHEFMLNEIEIQGKHIQPKIFYFSTTMMWLSSAIIFIFIKKIKYERIIVQAKKREDTYNRTAKRLKSDNEKLKLQINIDSLTKLPNRHAFELFSAQIDTSTEQDFGVLFIDIDNFKSINDTYGHTCGDQILAQFADMIQDEGPKEQASFRWGGEEFLMIVPLEKGAKLDEIANSIVTSTRNVKWHEDLPVTCSVGYSIFVKSINQTIDLADQALYRAKNSGRNQACNGLTS